MNVKTGQVIPTVSTAKAIDTNITNVSDVNNTDWVCIEDAKYKDKDYFTFQNQSGQTYQWKKKAWDPSDLKSSLYANFDASDSTSITKAGNDVSSLADSNGGSVSLGRAGSTSFPQ